MCSHYQALKENDKYFRYFGVEPPVDPSMHDLWPGYLGAFLRRHPNLDVGDEAVPSCEALTGLFGLVPHWSQDTKIVRHTFNARSETVAEKPSFREAWKRAQRCIIPAEAIFEPDWRSGKAVAILPTGRYQDWLQAPTENCMEFIQPFPAEALQADESLYKSRIDQQMF